MLFKRFYWSFINWVWLIKLLAIGDWSQSPASFTSWRAWSWTENCNPTFNHVVVSLGNQSLSWSCIESLTTYLFTVWIIINWKVLKEMGVMDHLTCLLRNLYAGQEAIIRTVHGTTDLFQKGKEYVKAVFCHPAYLTYMQNTSCETLGLMKQKLESRLPQEISITWDTQMIPPLWQKVKEELKSLLMKVKEESENAGLKINIQKTKIMSSSPTTSWQIEGETMETVTLFFVQNHCGW